MELNLINILYMFFRLAPFIIVSYFTLQSLFNQDLKGVMYLLGLLLASFATVMVASILPDINDENAPTQSKYSIAKCSQLTLGNYQRRVQEWQTKIADYPVEKSSELKEIKITWLKSSIIILQCDKYVH